LLAKRQQAITSYVQVSPQPTYGTVATVTALGNPNTYDLKIVCGNLDSICITTYALNSGYTNLVALPMSGYQFSGWGGDCLTTGTVERI